jgi:mannose-6-phosphate isomerase-like protein (cupin superfamily)
MVTGHQEVYAILEGDGTLTIAGEDISLTPGDYVRVDAQVTRRVTAGPDGLRFIAVGAHSQDAFDGRPVL